MSTIPFHQPFVYIMALQCLVVSENISEFHEEMDLNVPFCDIDSEFKYISNLSGSKQLLKIFQYLLQ